MFDTKMFLANYMLAVSLFTVLAQFGVARADSWELGVGEWQGQQSVGALGENARGDAIRLACIPPKDRDPGTINQFELSVSAPFQREHFNGAARLYHRDGSSLNFKAYFFHEEIFRKPTWQVWLKEEDFNKFLDAFAASDTLEFSSSAIPFSSIFSLNGTHPIRERMRALCHI